MKRCTYILLGIWWCMIIDRSGENRILIETRYESTCVFYQKLMKRVPYLKVTDCQYKERANATEIG